MLDIESTSIMQITLIISIVVLIVVAEVGVTQCLAFQSVFSRQHKEPEHRNDYDKALSFRVP